MREYKFKGKNKDIGWVYGQLAYDINGNTYIIQEVELDSSYGLEETILFATMWHRVDKETVGQYTGLKDKNGEIYEGDIVSFNLKSDSEGQPNITGYIEYQTTFSSYRIMSLKGSFALDYNIKDIEAIGNIYDNPELLEKGE